MPHDIEAAVKLLRAAAEPNRLAILRYLEHEDEQRACNFHDCCKAAQPTISYHLKVLWEAGWVRRERRGSCVWYALEPNAARRLRAIFDVD